MLGRSKTDEYGDPVVGSFRRAAEVSQVEPLLLQHQLRGRLSTRLEDYSRSLWSLQLDDRVHHLHGLCRHRV